MIFGIIALVMVLVGFSVGWHGYGNGWSTISQSAEFAYLIVILIFAIFAMVFCLTIYWIRQQALVEFMRATGILTIVLPVVAWLHSYAYWARLWGYDFGTTFNNLGAGAGWIVTLIGGIFFLISAHMIGKTIPLEKLTMKVAQPEAVPATQQPPQQPPEPPPTSP